MSFSLSISLVLLSLYWSTRVYHSQYLSAIYVSFSKDIREYRHLSRLFYSICFLSMCLCLLVLCLPLHISCFSTPFRILLCLLFLLYRSTTPSVFLHSFVVSLSCCRFLWQYLPLSLSLLVSMWSSLSLASTRGNLNLPVAIVTHLCQTTRAIKNE